MSMKHAFAALALGTALVAAPQAAQAEQPLANCDPSLIFETVADSRGAVKAFGEDLCVYNVIAGRPLAIHNYDQNVSRETQAFSNEYNRAKAGATAASQYAARQAAAEQRQAQIRQQQCERQMASVIGSALDGRGVNYTRLLQAQSYCR